MLDETKRSEAVKNWKRSLAIHSDQPKINALVKEYSQGLFP